MSAIAIRAEDLGKRFEIGRLRDRHPTLREALARAVRGRRGRPADFWALKGVSFEVAQGEVVGIIGPNGAGKSTLLKILSRITEPTTGAAEVHGRVGSLLEVGTGFHPDLTGRENVYLNGAVLGMRRAEIARKFDEIVAFAEIGPFLDTPVKRYSSGMYLRLAFAVAAHLEPENLIVDEVLAVGDARFQRKCLGKMREVSAERGRTILFVSHSMSAIQRLCGRCLLIEGGELAAAGPTAEVVARYLASQAAAGSSLPGQWIDLSGVSRAGSGEARFEGLQYTSGNPAAAFQPHPGGPLEILVAVTSSAPRSVGNLALTFYDSGGAKLVNADTLALGHALKLREGRNLVRFRIEALHLNPGVYSLGFWIAGPGGAVWDASDSAVRAEVVEIEPPGPGLRPDGDGAVPCRFTMEQEAP